LSNLLLFVILAITPIDAMIEVGKQYPVMQSKQDSVLMQFAQAHSEHQARIRLQGHHRWESRKYKIQNIVGGNVEEICAESWYWNITPRDVANDMYKSWSQSPGHWSVVIQKHKAYGVGIAKGRNGIWYATILVKD